LGGFILKYGGSGGESEPSVVLRPLYKRVDNFYISRKGRLFFEQKQVISLAFNQIL
jgi:hypothetical protein